jgi:mono/diheme cytochrome c family protein
MHARLLLTLSATAALVLTTLTAATDVAPTDHPTAQTARSAHIPERHALRLIRDGRRYFRFATFASEDFWGGVLGLHEAIAGSVLGGTGAGLSPKQALDSGLKVDVASLPASVREALQADQLDLSDPAVTVELLRLNAVVGLTGFFNETGQLTSVGIQCALCHSTVNDSFAAGIGQRRDGWANRDLDIGAIIALAPRLQPLADLLETDVATVRKVLRSWGPGKFDASLFLDGKAFRPDGRSAAVLIPPAFGLAGVNLHTWTGWGSIPHWNALVANLEMRGKGTFFDPRLDDAERFPIAAREQFGHLQPEEDLITPALPALHLYQLSLAAPSAPRGSYDRAAASRGREVFNNKARCATCHVPPLFTEPGYNSHTAEEIGIDDFQAMRSPDGRYRTAPLRGLWTHMNGGFYHDGRFATLAEVVAHYERTLGLQLSAAERRDLEQYLRSL